MAAGGHRPLSVKQDMEGHYSVHDITIEGEQRLAVYIMSRPVVEPLHYRPLAVSAGGGTTLGVTPPAAAAPMGGPPIMLRPVRLGWAESCWAGAAGPISRLSSPAPAAEPNRPLVVGDDTIIRMDTVVYAGDSSRFEMLRRDFPGGGWSTIPLPRPPLRTLWLLPPQRVSISAYFVMGTRVWIYPAGHLAAGAPRGAASAAGPRLLRAGARLGRGAHRWGLQVPVLVPEPRVPGRGQVLRLQAHQGARQQPQLQLLPGAGAEAQATGRRGA